MTSSTADQSTAGLRSINARIGIAARSSARTVESAPPNRPNGVRTASQIKTSLTSISDNRATASIKPAKPSLYDESFASFQQGRDTASQQPPTRQSPCANNHANVECPS